MKSKVSWQQVLKEMPLIAIIRGVLPPDAVSIAEALWCAGLLCVEIPLNSPNALSSITKIRAQFAGRLFIGAGTVLTAAEVISARKAGAQFIVSPNTNRDVILTTKLRGLISVPGIATATDAFAAIDAGADALKLFPAELTSLSGLRALKAVLPASIPILPVGGITPGAMGAYIAAGAAGFGIGSGIYTPESQPQFVRERAANFAATLRAQRKLRSEFVPN